MKPWESCYLPNILHRVRPKQFPSLSGLRSVFQTFREPNSVSGYRRLTWTSSGGGLVAKSCLTLATLWTVACQAPLSMGFLQRSFTDCSDGKESVRNMGNLGSTPGLGRSPGEGNGNPLQYSCLENAMDGGAWQATAHGLFLEVGKS